MNASIVQVKHQSQKNVLQPSIRALNAYYPTAPDGIRELRPNHLNALFRAVLGSGLPSDDVISSHSTFYLRNTVTSYPSNIKQVKTKLQ